MRFFNTAGPMIPEDQYYVPLASRIAVEELTVLIDQKKYFVLHAPRQTGKTTCLLALMHHLNQSGTYKCLYVNVESAQVARENVAEAMQAILYSLAAKEAFYLKEFVIKDAVKSILETGPYTALEEMLSYWTARSDLPTVVMIDEIDSLVGDTLISVLRQIRSRYPERPQSFPQSIILCGVRDVRDYRIYSGSEKDVITGGSCFNIKANSIRLGNFTKEDVVQLYEQHTAETGQEFAPAAVELAYELTKGQPWLVNALANTACFEMEQGKNRANPVTVEIIEEAKERLILERAVHIDQLIDKLKEKRVQSVIEPILVDSSLAHVPEDDLRYVTDLGLVVEENRKVYIANPIYKEIIPRELNYITQNNFTMLFSDGRFVKENGDLDMKMLLQVFQQFFRENSEIWIERFDYKEAGPHLLLQAFLQRIVNGGGRIQREYGLGRQRTDILIEWRNGQKHLLELKIKYRSLEGTIAEGIGQISDYMDKVGISVGHLLIFDRSKDASWDQKIFQREEKYQGRIISIWGM